MFKKRIILTFALVLYCCVSFAQTDRQIITGTVKTTDGQPAEFISIGLKNTPYGTSTDAKGNFRFEAPSGEYIMNVSSIAAHRKEIPVTIEANKLNHFPDITIVESALGLGEVVVTGTRTEKRLSETPVLTTVIRDNEIRKAASVSALESLQDNIPGIVILPNAMGNNLRIKGLNSRYILFLVDGERLVSESAGGSVNLDQIDVNTIKRIEMVDGASSALYGSNAVGAVINIITKEPVHTIEVGTDQTWENYNTWRSRLEAGTSLKKFSARAGGFRNASDGFGSTGDGPYAARYEDYGSNLKLGYKLAERSDINVIGRYFRHETFNPEGSLNVKHSLTDNLAVGANGGFTTPNNKNTLRVSANFNKYFDYDVLEKKDNEHTLKNSAAYFSSRAVNTLILSDKWDLVGGLEYNHEENFATSTLGAEPTTKSIDDANLFTQAQYKLLKNFEVVAGARYTYNSQFGSALTPKLSLMYGVNGFRFRGGIGTSFRAPSIKELYYDFDHRGMFWMYGNPDLQPEKGLYTSLSVEYTRGGFNASVSGYHNKIDNKITLYDVITEQGKNEKYYKNVSSATLKGVDVNAAYTFFKQLVLKGNYSYCDATDNSTGLQLSSNVKHSGTVSATWNGSIMKSPFSLQLAGRMNSPILYQQMVTGEDGTQQAVFTESKSYSVWKAVLVKPFRFGGNVLDFTFKVDNLFDFKDSSFINPGRQYLIGIRYNFKTQINSTHKN